MDYSDANEAGYAFILSSTIIKLLIQAYIYPKYDQTSTGDAPAPLLVHL